MDAIRQFIDVENHTFKVTLPDDFNAKRVEIIILPSNNEDFSISKATQKMLDKRLEQYHQNQNDVYDFDELLKELNDEL